jgi:hypothetical protein
LLRCRDNKQEHQPAAVFFIFLLMHYIQTRQTPSFPACQELQCTAFCQFAVMLVMPRGRPLQLARVCAMWLLRCRDNKQEHQPAAVFFIFLQIHYIQIRQIPSFPSSQELQCTASCYFAVMLVMPRGRPLRTTGRCLCIVVAEMQGQQAGAPASSSILHLPADALHTNKSDSILPCISGTTVHSLLLLCSDACYA